MRIVYVVRRYWPAPGGVETFLHQTAVTLARRHDVTVLTHGVDDAPMERLTESLRPPAAFEPFDDDGVRVEQIRFDRGHRLLMLPMVAQTVRGPARFAYGRMRIVLAALYARAAGGVLLSHVRDADLVHTWSADLVGASALHAARRAGRPCVVTPFVHPGQWGDDPASKRLYRAAEQVVGLLEVEREVFAALGVPPAKVTVCGPCSTGVPVGGGRALRARHGIEGPLVVFLGVRRPYKGYELLLRAAGGVAERVPEAVFAFVGPGDPLPQTDAGVRVLDVGPVGEDERGAWLDAADLFCLPSEHEIFPVSVLEAWSARTPALVSDLPPLRELMERSGGGEAVARSEEAVADGIVRLLRDEGARRRMGEAGHAFWLAGHTPDAVARSHERLYERILAR
jgi:glycosyltransferase involved in cell wall biosynthesis